MAQVTGSIVLADGQATPVNQTFSPEKISPDLAVFSDKSSGVSSFFRKLYSRFSPASVQRRTTRTVYEVECPVTGTVDGVVQVIRTNRAKVEFILADGCTDAERKDLYAFMYNGMNNALIRGVLRDYDPMY